MPAVVLVAGTHFCNTSTTILCDSSFTAVCYLFRAHTTILFAICIRPEARYSPNRFFTLRVDII